MWIRLLVFVFFVFPGFTGFLLAQNDTNRVRWWKGNLHAHSLWSDGNDFPEMIAKWYSDHGYNFLTLSDHNILSEGDKWMDLDTIKNRGGETVLQKYEAAYGKDWVERTVSKTTSKEQIRLKPLGEFRQKLERPNEFLLMTGEEISDSVGGAPVHMNATNLLKLIRPLGGNSVREAMRNNLRAAREQAEVEGREILVHLNHPNFGWAVTAEDLAAVTEEQFVEVYNGHPSVNHLGNDQRASVEQIWDIANTLRIAKLGAPPLFGLATDDGHNYHGKPGSHPGRGWIMVRSKQLNAESLIVAMRRGDFYCSSGVSLIDIRFEPENKTLSLQIDVEKGVTYRTQFIGTRVSYDPSSKPRKDKDGNPIPTSKEYSADVGIVFTEEVGQKPNYQLKGDELYVRAVVTSSRDHVDPSFKGQKQQAWTQPIGWRSHLEKGKTDQ